MKKLLITGVGGFVGSYLVDYFLKNTDYSIYGTVLPNEKYDNNSINVLQMDLTQKASIDKIMESVKPDLIIHLAAQSSVKKSWADPVETLSINILGSIMLLDSIRKHNPAARTLLVGSSEEYGNSFKFNSVASEELKCNPQNIYAISKLSQNHIGAVYSKAYNLDIIMTRSFNHIGPKQSSFFVVSDFCKQVALIENKKQEGVIRVGNLNSYRDFTDVRDIVRAYHLLLENGKSGETYNVGCGQAIKVEDILKYILSLSESNISVEIDQNKFRPIEVQKIEADITKIKKDVNWQPSIDIKDSIEEVLNYWRAEIKKEKQNIK